MFVPVKLTEGVFPKLYKFQAENDLYSEAEELILIGDWLVPLAHFPVQLDGPGMIRKDIRLGNA